MKKIIWLSYDLGVKGDYEGLYAWLDDHDAKECGDSLAVLSYEFQADSMEELKSELSKNVKLSKRDRVYVVWQEGQKVKGHFLFGSRKASPWIGYGSHEPMVDEEA